MSEEVKLIDKRHEHYDEMLPQWTFFSAAYRGIWGYLKYANQTLSRTIQILARNPRESKENYEQRKAEAYTFNFSKSVINLLNFYLFEKKPVRDISFADNELWQMFLEDCNLFGKDYNKWIVTQQRIASKLGHIGAIVTAPTVQSSNVNESVEKKIYPYVIAYKPQDILWWKYERDVYGRPYLSELLLKEGDNYKYWTPYHWEAINKEGEIISEEDHFLREIPFVWLLNIEDEDKHNVGISDIDEISRIDSSILNMLSQAEEVIKYSAFLMMRKPYEQVSSEGAQNETTVGATAILWFDPELPNSKPDWLEANVEKPINAIIQMLKIKAENIYRQANIGGLAATEPSRWSLSGESLKQQFRMLNSNLSQKATNLEEFETQIIRLWLKYTNLTNEDVNIKYSRDFSLRDLDSDLKNLTTIKINTISDLLKKEIEKDYTQIIMEGKDPEKTQEIIEEIENASFQTNFEPEGI